MSYSSIDLYDNVYADFASSAEAAVRRETYGEDLGQSSWLTASEWLGFADQRCGMAWLPCWPAAPARALEAGHFFPEEIPDQTADALSAFFLTPP